MIGHLMFSLYFLSQHCKDCGKQFRQNTQDKRRQCKDCHDEQRHPAHPSLPASPTSSSSSSSSVPSPLFDRPQGCIDQLSTVERAAIVTLHIHIIEFPPRSPDLNPIENLWHVLKFRVEHRNPRTAEDFERVIAEEYEAISVQECATLARSMHARLEQCIQYEGHKTKYELKEF
jgi:hypothetical protein